MSNVVDRNKANDLMAKCKAALSQVLEAEGFELTKISAKFGDSFGFSVSAIPKATNELGLNPNSAQVVDFHRYHSLYGIEPNALGVKFTVGRSTYTFEGLQMSRRKYPIAVDQEGRGKILLTDDPRVIGAINAAAKLAASAPAPSVETDDPAAPPAPAGKKKSPRKP